MMRRSDRHEQQAQRPDTRSAQATGKSAAPKHDHLQRLQRQAGNSAVTDLLRDRAAPKIGLRAVQRVDPVDPRFKPQRRAVTDAKEISGMQFRIHENKIQVVKRVPLNEEFVYMALGEVDRFNGPLPVIALYKDAEELRGWRPRITHINGMDVMPDSGLESAITLRDEARDAARAMQGGQLFDRTAFDVLYTYSAAKGPLDLWDCLKGKMELSGTTTRMQKQIMLDAVRGKKKVSISAHSRGTIKTDNAVQQAYRELLREVRKELGEKRFSKTDRAPAETRRRMDQYVKLIYAGNAVTFPSAILPITFVVQKGDPVTAALGVRSKFGADQTYAHKESKVKQIGSSRFGKKYHNYQDAYAGAVGEEVAKNI